MSQEHPGMDYSTQNCHCDAVHLPENNQHNVSNWWCYSINLIGLQWWRMTLLFASPFGFRMEVVPHNSPPIITHPKRSSPSASQQTSKALHMVWCMFNFTYQLVSTEHAHTLSIHRFLWTRLCNEHSFAMLQWHCPVTKQFSCMRWSDSAVLSRVITCCTRPGHKASSISYKLSLNV
jgi:hypothetical protein